MPPRWKFKPTGLLALLIASITPANGEYIVSTIAGGVAPVTPVAASKASIGAITGITIDAAGNIYLSTARHCVFKLAASGTVTRIAGTCRPGLTGDGGPAVNAQLCRPSGLAVDRDGSLYIADSGNQAVRKVSPDGIITTVAGTGRQDTSGNDGPATKAALANPHAVALDTAGNLYIAELNAIRRVSPDGIITNFIGNGAPGIAADGRTPIKPDWMPTLSLTVDPAGNLYAATFNEQVVQISPAGVIRTVAGVKGKAGYSGDGGPASDAQLSYPYSVALDREGNVYIDDARNFRIRKVSTTGAISTIAREEAAPKAAWMPWLLAADPHGALYAAGDGRLRKISPDGAISTVLADEPAPFKEDQPALQSQIYFPADIAVDSTGNIFIAEIEKQRVRKIDRHGRITTVAGDGKVGQYCQLAADAKGNLFISDAHNHRVSKVSPKGVITTVAGTGSPGFSGDGGPAAKAQLNMPEGIAFDFAGNLYISDRNNGRIRKVAVNGAISTYAGNGGQGHFADGRPALDVPLKYPGKLAIDSEGNLYLLEGEFFPQLRKVSSAGIVSTVSTLQNAMYTQSIAVDAAGALYLLYGGTLVSGSRIARLGPDGNMERVAGTGKSGYSGDGGPASTALFANLSGIAIDRHGRIYVSDGYANAVRMLTPLPSPPDNISDLHIELRSATGSNRFQFGAEIPLEAVFSSSTPKRYLEPCLLFKESYFGYPHCRFYNHWSFSIVSGKGWVDLTQEFPSGPQSGSGFQYEVPSPALTAKPAAFSYILTHRFRFDAPGDYRVRLALDIGFDDATTQPKSPPDVAVQPHQVSLTRDIVLHIVPAEPEWQTEIIRQGVNAFSSPVPQQSNPPSAAYRQSQEARKALCNLGTPQAARALAKLLLNSANHQKEENCLQHTASPGAAIEEMERLLVDPEARIYPGFFYVLVMLLGREESKAADVPLLVQSHVDEVREKLFAALPQKHGEAQITSLLTVLANPASAKGNAHEFGHTVPFSPAVIAMTIANFDSFPPQSRDWLVDDGWDRVRSPLMLPAVREMAKDGDGHALLRWLELDPAAATEFIRQEVVRPTPRFSSFYFRLPDESLPDQEARIAENFVALSTPRDLTRSATLLHRYATAAVLARVLPSIDANLVAWPCSVQIPVLAYLLKVSPTDAEPRLQAVLHAPDRGYCGFSTLFTNIGFLQPSPVLEQLALAEIDKSPATSFATDAAAYLRRYGSPAAKPLVYKRLVKWRQVYVASGAEKRWNDHAPTKDDNALRALVQALTDSFARAQSWLLSPRDVSDLQALLGPEAAAGISCIFNCGAQLGTGDSPAHFAIYGRVNEKFERKAAPMEFLNPMEKFHYSINQYRCDNLQDLEQKMLQFPAGSTFDFAWDFTAADREEVLEIANFLHSHGYRVGGTHEWPFLQPDPPQ